MNDCLAIKGLLKCRPGELRHGENQLDRNSLLHRIPEANERNETKAHVAQS
jgi:hypothetical protein